MAGVSEVLMPLMGEGIMEATLVKWLKKPGDPIKKEEPLLEVSTDKVDTEIPSPAAGFLVATFAVEGEAVPVNKVIAHIAASAAGGADAAPPEKTAGPAAKTAPGAGDVASPSAGLPADLAVPVPPKSDATSVGIAAPAAAALLLQGGSVTRRSSPLVRKIARDKGIDLSHVAGSGLHGRITRRDVEAFLVTGAASGAGRFQAPPAARATGTQDAHLEWGRLQTKNDSGRETLEGVVVRREPMSRMRQLIAEHMVRSVRTSPHVTTVFEIDMHRVANIREKAKSSFAKSEGFNLTFTAFFIHAAVQAIKRHPVVNVSVDGNDILWKDQINVGVAVAIESGLIVPVIRNAGELNLTGVARRLNDLSTRARSKKLSPDDVQGGTFSITNPGMFGSIVSTPIINQPQVAILSIGAVVKRPVVIDDMIAVRPLVQVGLTFDHRVVDGEGGARYLATLKETLESYDESAL